MQTITKCVSAIVALALLQGTYIAQTSAQAGGGTPPHSSPQLRSVEPSAATSLRIVVGKSVLVSTTGRLKRVSVADPNIADAVVVSPAQVLINGRSTGNTTLILWNEQENWRSFDLLVEMDIDAAQKAIKATFPDEQIKVEPAQEAIVLSGYVSTRTVAQHAGMLAGAYSKNVINALNYAAPW
jgi:pilus assembly protein CpaC